MSFRRWVTGLFFAPLFVLAVSACEPDDMSGDTDDFSNDTDVFDGDTDDFGTGPDTLVSVEGSEWQTTIASTDTTPDLEDADVRMFIPSDTAYVRGILIFSRNGVGDTEYEHNAWRSAAATVGMAVINIELRDCEERLTPWESADQSVRLLNRMFTVLAELSGHPELAEAPLFFFGHSAGAFWFTRLIPRFAERTAGFIAFQGSLTCDRLFSPEALAIPGMFVIAEYDPIWIRTGTTEIVDEGLKKGALWSLTVQPDVGHWDIDPSRSMMIAFMRTVFDRRLPPQSESGAPSTLLPFPLDDIRLGTLTHRNVYDEEERIEGNGREIITAAVLLPPETPPDPTRSYHRLVSSGFAEAWVSYEVAGIDTIPIL